MKLLIFSLITTSLAWSHLSYTTILERCNEQNLEPAQGKIRNQWAKKCFPKHQDYFDFFANKKPVRYALVWSPSKNSWSGPINANAP